MLLPAELRPTSGDDVLVRYRRLRAIMVKQHTAALEHLPTQVILDHARGLGLAYGKTLVMDSEDELDVIFDLAIHSPRNTKSRAIDRYRKAARHAPHSDEAILLDAMCAAEFSIWRVERRHEVAGLVLLDAVRGGETWLIDEGLTQSLEDRRSIATRLARPGPFAMTCGVALPVDREILQDALDALPDGAPGTPGALASDPRFAMAVYRAALDAGVMEAMSFV